MGVGGGSSGNRNRVRGGLWFNVSLLTLSCEAGLHEVLTVDLLCVCVLSACTMALLLTVFVGSNRHHCAGLML